MSEVTTIGVDLAKNVFQVHGVTVAGEIVIRRQLRRRHVLSFFEKPPRCLVGMAELIARRPTKVAAVALANKMARIAWVVLTRGESYRKPAVVTAAT